MGHRQAADLGGLGYLGIDPGVNVITPQGLEPFQFSTKFGALSPFMLKRIRSRARAEHVECPRVGMPPDRLEERVAGRDPL